MDTMDSCDVEFGGSLHVNELPDDALEKIFSFLNHSELLEARLVHPRWDYVIGDAMTKHFLCTTTFKVPQHGYEKALESLESSLIRWKSIHLAMDANDEYDSLYYFMDFFAKSEVTQWIWELEISHTGQLDWMDLQRLVVRFPNVTSLTLSLRNGKIIRSTEELAEFSTLLTQLSSLRIEFHDNLLGAPVILLPQFFTATRLADLGLIFKLSDKEDKLSIKEHLDLRFGSGENGERRSYKTCLIEDTFKLISLNHLTLRNLKLASRCNSLAEDLSNNVLGRFANDPSSAPIKLQSFSFDNSVVPRQEVSDGLTGLIRNQDPLYKFISRQEQLVKLHLPEIDPRSEQYEAFVERLKLLPPSIKFLRISGIPLYLKSIATHLKNLKDLRCSGHDLKVVAHDSEEPMVAALPFGFFDAPIFQDPGELNLMLPLPAPQIYSKLTSLVLKSLAQESNYSELSKFLPYLPNLRNLVLEKPYNSLFRRSLTTSDPLDDLVIQACISSSQLWSLALVNFENISDFGVAGIKPAEKDDANSEKSFLAMLQDLRELRIVNQSFHSKITDEGIHHGLIKFPKLRSLEVTLGAKVTLNAIEDLIKNHPFLEKLSLGKRDNYTNGPRVEAIAKKYLRRDNYTLRLPEPQREVHFY